MASLAPVLIIHNAANGISIEFKGLERSRQTQRRSLGRTPPVVSWDSLKIPAGTDEGLDVPYLLPLAP